MAAARSPDVNVLMAASILFPFAAGALLLASKSDRARSAIVAVSALVVAALATAVAIGHGNGGPLFFDLPLGLTPGRVPFALELILSAGLGVLAIRHRRFGALALVAVQAALAVWLETAGEAQAEPGRLFAFDRLTLLMVLVVGWIGPLICVHAAGFMPDYQRQHADVPERQPSFFALLFVFLGAMFGLVFSNHLPLMHLFWEITTACSFLLIGYAGNPKAIDFAFGALRINLFGGIAFSVAIALLQRSGAGLDLALLGAAKAPAALIPALSLLALAGLTKSAQMPFSAWLLGAMQAPAPTSALLHSSTMVKAGVFLLLRLSPALRDSAAGVAITLVGAGSFLFSSLLATTEQNGKRVLAWSTIGNLGLVAACAGAGSPEALWVAAMLIVFHAAAKSLLFLVLGSLENRLHSKEVEAFDNLLVRSPWLSALVLTGASGMFLAPFGMVLAKWSAIRAFAALPGWLGATLVLVLAYGSACTLFYWSKLLLKIVAFRQVTEQELAGERAVTTGEWIAEGTQAALVVALTLFVGALSARVVGPWALATAGGAPHQLLSISPLLVAILALCVIALPLLALRGKSRGRYDLADIYVSGRTADAAHRVVSAAGIAESVRLRGYYLEGVFAPSALLRTGTLACSAVLLTTFLLQIVHR
jgi:ech hydrogenase subunit A